MMCKKFRVVALKMNILYNLCFTCETTADEAKDQTRQSRSLQSINQNT